MFAEPFHGKQKVQTAVTSFIRCNKSETDSDNFNSCAWWLGLVNKYELSLLWINRKMIIAQGAKQVNFTKKKYTIKQLQQQVVFWWTEWKIWISGTWTTGVFCYMVKTCEWRLEDINPWSCIVGSRGASQLGGIF